MKRKGRKRMPKVKGHYNRVGGVFRFRNTPWGPMNVMDGGRDAPVEPPSPRTRVVLWAVLCAAMLIAIAVVVVSL